MSRGYFGHSTLSNLLMRVKVAKKLYIIKSKVKVKTRLQANRSRENPMKTEFVNDKETNEQNSNPKLFLFQNL
jgi:hypothetical protein